MPSAAVAIDGSEKYRVGDMRIAALDRSETVQQAEELGKTVIEAFPDSPMAGQYRALARKLLEVCGVASC